LLPLSTPLHSLCSTLHVLHSSRLDEEAPNTRPHSLYQTVLESFGASMMVLCLLDFGRLFSGRALQIQGEKWLYLYNKQ
jgi:hypothetical protein